MSTRRCGLPPPSSTSAGAHFAPAAIDATLGSGVLKVRFSNLGAYGGQASGEVTADASAAEPSFALHSDLAGVRACRC